MGRSSVGLSDAQYVENGLSKLLGLLETRYHCPLPIAGMNKEDIRWLTYANSHWQTFERTLLENADIFRTAAARGDMRTDSDIDLMVMFDCVDHPTLEQIRRIQHRFEKLILSVYSLSNIGNIRRFFAMAYSTVHAISLARSALSRVTAKRRT
ncbi:MAG: hypothetical protein ACSLEN_03175 [Candidatus Malihini olakiniferum]